MGYNNEDARKLVELEIANRKEALKLYQAIIKVVERFDGYVLNKRFDTALKKVDKRLGYNRGFSNFEITFAGERSCMKLEGGAIYIRSFYIELNTYMQTYSFNKYEESFLENERMRASVLIDSLIKGKEYLENTIVQLEQGIDRADEWKTRIDQLKEEIKSIKQEIPYIIADYYGIE